MLYPSGEQESNLRPPGPKPGAMPLRHRPLPPGRCRGMRSAYVNGMPEEIEKGDDRKRDDDVDGPVRHFNPFHVFVCSTSAVSGDFRGFRVISGDFVPT